MQVTLCKLEIKFMRYFSKIKKEVNLIVKFENMKKFTLIITIVFLSVTMCTKENKDENLCYSNTLISQVNSGDLAIHGLTYNSSCLIYESTEPFKYQKFSYDSRNLLNKVEVAYSFNPFSCVMIPGQSPETDPRKAEVSQYSEFEYNDALRLIKRSDYFTGNGNSQLISYQTYDYENDRVVKLSYFNPQEVLIEFHDYTYDNNGNITRDDQYSNYSEIKLTKTVLYEFDDKNNPYQVFACEGDPGKFTNKNNIIKETSVSYNGPSESHSTRSNVYEYNILDFPVKINEWDCIYGK